MAVLALNPGKPLTVMDYLTTFDEDNLEGIDCSKMNFIQVLTHFFDEVNEARIKKRNNDIIKSLKDNIISFQNECCEGMYLKPIHFTKQFITMFKDWLKQRISPSTKKKLQDTYIRKLTQTLKRTLAWASEHKAKVAPDYMQFDFKVEYKREHTPISDAEVWMIYAIDFKSHQKEWNIRDIDSWERARDMFVLQCNLGMRASDMRKLKREMYHDGTIYFRQQKTKGIAAIDLKRMTIDYEKTMEILNKYDFEAPCKLSISNYNKKIHKICMFAGLTQDIADHAVQYGETCILTRPKYKDCSSHTSRRTFITYHDVKMQHNAEEIMRATGQKSISVMKNYSKHSEDFRPQK